MKMLLPGIGIFFLLLVLGLAWCAYPWSLNEHVQHPEIVTLEPKQMVHLEEEPWVLKILTWNTSYFYGEGSEGVNYRARDRAYFEQRLKETAVRLKEWDADVVFLQEIDFEAARTFGVNQARWLAEEAGYPYVAEAVSWEANYIPFPYLPFSQHFGSMRSGGAILSRYQLSDHKVSLLTKPQANPWWYNLFYPHRYFQEVNIHVGSKTFKLINLHLEAFSKVDRLEEAKLLKEKIINEKIDFIAGDFNTTPEIAVVKSKFPNGDDYEGDKSHSIILSSGLLEVVPDDIYAASESTYFTFPSGKPDRRLDYIFYRPGLKMMKAEVLSSGLSDHLPLRASFQVGTPKVNPYSL